MTTLELKHRVIDKINYLNDDSILSEVYRILEDFNSENDFIQISEDHKNSIDMAIEQINNGEYVTDEEANLEIEKWLIK